MSTIRVNQIQDTSTNVAANISGGVVTFNNPPVGAFISVADQWRLTSDVTGSSSPLSSNLERVDTGGQGTIGTAMSVSSGIFTFPATGIYSVRACFVQADGSTDNRYVTNQLDVTTNNSSYATIAEAVTHIKHISGATYVQSSLESLVNVTDTSNVKVRFNVVPAQGSVLTKGNTAYNQTCFTFIRLGA